MYSYYIHIFFYIMSYLKCYINFDTFYFIYIILTYSCIYVVNILFFMLCFLRCFNHSFLVVSNIISSIFWISIWLEIYVEEFDCGTTRFSSCFLDRVLFETIAQPTFVSVAVNMGDMHFNIADISMLRTQFFLFVASPWVKEFILYRL